VMVQVEKLNFTFYKRSNLTSFPIFSGVVNTNLIIRRYRKAEEEHGAFGLVIIPLCNENESGEDNLSRFLILLVKLFHSILRLNNCRKIPTNNFGFLYHPRCYYARLASFRGYSSKWLHFDEIYDMHIFLRI